MKNTLVILASLALALTASARSIKAGIPNIKTDERQSYNQNFGDTWEFEGHSPRFAKGYLDVSGSLGITSLKSEGELETTTGTIAKQVTRMYDVRLTSRIYPLGQDNYLPFTQYRLPIIPFIGGGTGFFSLETTERGPGYPTSCSGGTCLYTVSNISDTLAEGLYGHVNAGFYFPFTTMAADSRNMFGLVVEDRYDFGKNNNNFQLGGNTFLVGLTWRFL